MSKPRLSGSEVRVSKLLSWLLRHSAEKEGIPLDSAGFARLSDVLQHRSLRRTDEATVRLIVEMNDKKRFELKEEGGEVFIRASQGHSIRVRVRPALSGVRTLTPPPCAVRVGRPSAHGDQGPR